MGQPKLALPLGDRTVLERVVWTLVGAGAHPLVVLAPHVAELAAPARTAGARVLQLEEPTPDMRTTVERGLEWLDEKFYPYPDDFWLLVPADHPVLDAGLIRGLCDKFRRQGDSSIGVPTFEGNRGHPALIRWKHLEGIRAFPKGQGLNAYLRQFAAETLEIPVDSPDVLIDLDTPEDYERLKQRFDEG
jgi:molybdenum cofactor cytidylyltransferase